MEKEEKSEGLMYKIAEFIVDKRKAIYIAFAAMIVYSLVCIPKVGVNDDITSYLPDTTETRRGVSLMEEEFTTYGVADVMVSNISYESAEGLKNKLLEIDNVKDIEFDNTPGHYKDSAALFTITFDDDGTTEESKNAMLKINETLSEYDTYISTEVGKDEEADLQKEMTTILMIAAVIILLVLLFTSDTYMEIAVFVIVFIVAAILNMGTNYWFGEISFITNSVAVVLQLALAIDYAIILSQRFAEERADKDAREAIITALSKAIIEISSSSLTTISGLVALMFMQLRIGMDLGLVLAKGIIFSLLTVFLLMPGLLLMFSGLIDKTRHKSFVPNIDFWGKIVVKTRFVIPIIFVVSVIGGMIFSNMCSYSYDTESVAARMKTPETLAKEKINENFGVSSDMAIILPKGDYESEKKILEEVSGIERVTNATGLANTEAERNGKTYVITDKLTPRQAAEFLDMDYDAVCILYQAYGISKEEYGALFNDVDSCKISIIDLVEYIHEQMDKGIINLDEEEKNEFNDIYNDLQDGKKQLESDNYSRLVFKYSGNVEGDESYKFLEDVRNIAKQYYDDPIIVSNTTASFDLYKSFKTDNIKISIMTIIFVFAILMVTFRSVGLPALLVLTIQGSIWINFSVTYFTKEAMYFLSYLVVSSIQMGATIDYAIVMTNRYEQNKNKMEHKKAVIQTINEAFPTIFTSGSILSVAGFLVGKLSTDAVVSSLGMALGRGTVVSIILVMLVLPQELLLCNKFIEKTYFTEREHTKRKRRVGITVIDGRISGYVNGYLEGTFTGVIRGDIDARLDNAQELPKLKSSESVTEIERNEIYDEEQSSSNYNGRGMYDADGFNRNTCGK